RRIPCEVSSWASIASGETGSQKLGHPEPDSNFLSDVNSGALHAAQWYIPSSWLSSKAPVKARSVPFSRMIWNCSGVSSSRHSASVFWTFCLSDISGLPGKTVLSLFARAVAISIFKPGHAPPRRRRSDRSRRVRLSAGVPLDGGARRGGHALGRQVF